MICQSSAANIGFEMMKALKNVSASKRFTLINIPFYRIKKRAGLKSLTPALAKLKSNLKVI